MALEIKQFKRLIFGGPRGEAPLNYCRSHATAPVSDTMQDAIKATE